MQLLAGIKPFDHVSTSDLMIDDGRPVVALIPARGGSKGLPRKNMTVIAGKPLIAYTIAAAKRSTIIDETFVSSDDNEILKTSAALGAQVILRPEHMANDTASPVAVVQHFVDALSESTRDRDPVVVYLQPTSPLRNEHHIDSLLREMSQARAFGAVSVVEANDPPYKAFRLDEKGRLLSLFDERLSNARRQDLPRCFYPNGAIYAFKVSAFESRNGFPSNDSLPFIMSRDESIDIDNQDDLVRAEAALRGVEYA